MNRFTVTDLPLMGLKRLQRHQFFDSRGFFSRIFCAEELEMSGWVKPIAQVNHTYTAKQGTVRGMHFQNFPHAEMKLVTCIRGEVMDVVVDIRIGSSTFLQWHAERLSAADGCAILIPEGFAHGFQALTDNVDLLYCHSRAYQAQSERGLNPADPLLNISWPLPITELSSRDAGQSLIRPDFEGVRV